MVGFLQNSNDLILSFENCAPPLSEKIYVGWRLVLNFIHTKVHIVQSAYSTAGWAQSQAIFHPTRIFYFVFLLSILRLHMHACFVFSNGSLSGYCRVGWSFLSVLGYCSLSEVSFNLILILWLFCNGWMHGWDCVADLTAAQAHTHSL